MEDRADSNANRTRDPKVMQTFFWTVYDIFRNEEPVFIRGRHHGRLSKFRLRGIYAIDSTTIQLAFWCIDWAKHRQRKAAVKVHMVANVANRLPHFCVFGKAKDHDSKMHAQGPVPQNSHKIQGSPQNYNKIQDIPHEKLDLPRGDPAISRTCLWDGSVRT